MLFFSSLSNTQSYYEQPITLRRKMNNYLLTIYLFCLLRLTCRFCFLRAGGLLSKRWWRDSEIKYRSKTTSCCCKRLDDRVTAPLPDTRPCCSEMIAWRQSFSWWISKQFSVKDKLKKEHVTSQQTLLKSIF